ncbi:MAG: hypothetical protein K2H43_01270, partial [Clostridia bacterium]|nr:hypothetical protein [Clostridia bacterium]
MNVKQSLLDKIRDGSFALLTAGQITHKLRLGEKATRVIREHLQALCRSGELLCDSRERYGTAEQFGAIRGTISGNERGFGFFVPEDKQLPDLFLPHRFMNGALHGDTVLAVRRNNRADSDEGDVLAILSRGRKEFVGTFFAERKGGYVRPDEKK